MHTSVVTLFALVFFYGLLTRGIAIPPSVIIENPTSTEGNSGLAEAGTSLKKKFVPALFFKTNWFRAYQYCRYHGMHLASPETEDEEKQLMCAMEKAGLDINSLTLWTSGNDLAGEGDYMWMSSGKQITYKNWRTSEPNGGSNENCIVLGKGSSGYYWNDVDCATDQQFACEYFESDIKEHSLSEGQSKIIEYV